MKALLVLWLKAVALLLAAALVVASLEQLAGDAPPAAAAFMRGV
ncbi:hypothetical protein [Burkholderia gladioli]|nr:hypothetical protein [Burkholderia gladioli]